MKILNELQHIHFQFSLNLINNDNETQEYSNLNNDKYNKSIDCLLGTIYFFFINHNFFKHSEN